MFFQPGCDHLFEEFHTNTRQQEPSSVNRNTQRSDLPPVCGSFCRGRLEDRGVEYADTPEDICEEIRRFNALWEEEHPGMPIYLLPDNPHYPHELFDKNWTLNSNSSGGSRISDPEIYRISVLAAAVLHFKSAKYIFDKFRICLFLADSVHCKRGGL